MNVQLDEVAVIGTAVSCAAITIVTVIGGVWKLLDTFKTELSIRMTAVDKGLEDRQDAWRETLEAHIKAESAEFESLHELRTQLELMRRDFESGYVSKEEFREQLARLNSRIDEILRIVDARTHSGSDPVSGRPLNERRAG